MWRVVLSGKATLAETRTVYSFEDLLDFHEAIDWEIERRAVQEAQR